MRQASLKLKSYAGNISIVDNDNLKRRVLYFMFSSLGLLGMFYVLILGNMVFNIVERRTLDGSARLLENEVAGLELAYLQASNKVDLVLAESMGFKEAKIKFAVRKASLGNIKMSLNDL